MLKIKQLMDVMIHRDEAIIYLMVENSEHSTREIGRILGMSHENVRAIHTKIAAKVEALKEAGLIHK